jgi:hypothetical protein
MFGKYIGASVLVAAVAVTAVAMRSSIDSGLKVGDFVSAFHPNHVTGPHKGTDTCPPCTYGKMPQVQVWVNGDDAKNVSSFATLLDKRVGDWHKSNLKAFFIFVTDKQNQPATKKAIEDIVAKSGVKIAMAWIDKNDEAIEQYAINTDPSVKNTVLVYKDMQVTKKFVNLVADQKGLGELNKAVDGIVK